MLALAITEKSKISATLVLNTTTKVIAHDKKFVQAAGP
jgi:hypothetical protein